MGKVDAEDRLLHATQDLESFATLPKARNDGEQDGNLVTLTVREMESIGYSIERALKRLGEAESELRSGEG